jgi:hypothetical protein
VWLGRDELLGRRVAIKRIGQLPGTDGTDVARAEREARLGARLHHPHVVAVFDVVADPETDEHWLVMEYVEGTDLAALVATRGALPPAEAAPLLGDVADALVAAHALGITHRDVKPSNILVGVDGTVKLSDFGIARVATDESLTQTGLVTGSPAYIAPEVASGGRGDEAADVWSLGATAFHVLAGRPPYEVNDHVLATLYRIVNDEPPRLGDGGWADALLEGTMVRDPAQRWSMAQVRDYLSRPGQVGPTRPEPARAVAGDGATQVLTVTRAAPAEEPRRAREFGRSHHPSALLLVGLAVAACLLLAVLLRATLADRGDRNPAGPGASPTPTGTTRVVATKPTARGMERFIRDYVTTVADDPDKAWSMLTPKFQRESGGLGRYRSFWDSATNGKVLSITADPTNLSVSYQVHFDNWDNGPGPTVLDLVFEDGRYLIDGERTKGFVPAD